jgi:hypothetical protein
MLQGLVLIGLAIALRPLPLPAEVKPHRGRLRRCGILRLRLASHQPSSWSEARPLVDQLTPHPQGGPACGL